MNREEFINALNEKIQNDPDHNEIVSYYYELINDKIDSGMTEEEAIESLGDLDSIVKNIEESKSEDVKENINDDSKEAKEEKKEKVIDNTTETKEVRQEVSGGRKFAYVLWTIATIFMCIGSIIVLIVAIAAMVGSIAAMIASITIVATSTSMASFYFGIGLFAFGATLVGVYYAKTLVSFIFHHRPRWKQNVRKGLAGE